MNHLVVIEKHIHLSQLINTRTIWKEVIVERRLYFLLPDVAHARAVVAKLEKNGIERKYTHVIAAKGIDLEGLPLASPNQRMDLGARLETILRDGNLVSGQLKHHFLKNA